MSCSSSKSPSPSPTYHYHHHHLSPPSLGPSPSKSMDEVWKDLSLSSFHNQHHRSTTTHNATTNTHPASFHDLLPAAAAAAADPPPPHRIPLNLNLNSSRHPPPPPADHDMGMGGRRTTHNNALPSLAPPFNVLAAASPLLPSLLKKRPRGGDDDNSGDRRHNRLMKNRESAARSRARKQAYTNELELEVAHLIEENAKLKKLQEQHFCPAAPSQLPKKHTLYRTLTAPF